MEVRTWTAKLEGDSISDRRVVLRDHMGNEIENVVSLESAGRDAFDNPVYKIELVVIIEKIEVDRP